MTDPFEASVGLTPARGQNEIGFKTLTSWPLSEEKEPEETHLIRGSGNYEIKGIKINGWPLLKESSDKFFKTVYKVKAEEMDLVFLGHLSGSDLPAEAMSELKDSHLLFIPAGGKPFINQESATKLIKQLNPKIVVASFFKTPGLKRTSADWKALADEIGQKPEVVDHLTIKRKEVAEQKGTKLIVLKI